MSHEYTLLLQWIPTLKSLANSPFVKRDGNIESELALVPCYWLVVYK